MPSEHHPRITLYRGWNDHGQYVWSPFVTKLEFRLRTSNIAYTCAAGAPHSGPKGKIPYIELQVADGPTDTIGDSAIILKHLIEANVVADLNTELSAAQRGQDLAVRALLEDKLYFYHTRERWVNNYYVMRDRTLWSIPYPMRIVVGLLAYRGNVRKLYDQGAGRFDDADILEFKTEIWEGINGMLVESKKKSEAGGGQKECFWILGGPNPTEADAVLFGFVVSVLVCDAGPESRRLVKGYQTVVDYAERIHGRWFPDYEMWP